MSVKEVVQMCAQTACMHGQSVVLCGSAKPDQIACCSTCHSVALCPGVHVCFPADVSLACFTQAHAGDLTPCTLLHCLPHARQSTRVRRRNAPSYKWAAPACRIFSACQPCFTLTPVHAFLPLLRAPHSCAPSIQLGCNAALQCHPLLHCCQVSCNTIAQGLPSA
jgi:hypothetical protein